VSVDALLEDARVTQDNQARIDLLLEAGQIIDEEHPAVFIAQPTLTYLVKQDINLANMNRLGRPSDRFSNISSWHTQTDSLWQMFRNEDI
jgi:ABC-type transport system substrate-binding protein